MSECSDSRMEFFYCDADITLTHFKDSQVYDVLQFCCWPDGHNNQKGLREIKDEKKSQNRAAHLQFYHFLHYVTDLRRDEIMTVFDLLDWEGKGEVGFDEFYLLVCIVMSHENHLEKQFMYRHSHLVFELLDIDGGHTVGLQEFKATRFLFNIKEEDLSRIFKDFDISGDEALNYKEFKMFTIFCIDRQQKKQKEKLEKQELTDKPSTVMSATIV